MVHRDTPDPRDHQEVLDSLDPRVLQAIQDTRVQSEEAEYAVQPAPWVILDRQGIQDRLVTLEDPVHPVFRDLRLFRKVAAAQPE